MTNHQPTEVGGLVSPAQDASFDLYAPFGVIPKKSTSDIQKDLTFEDYGWVEPPVTPAPLPTLFTDKFSKDKPTDGSMKYDKGKPLANILFEDFPHALSAVIDIATYGAEKYARNSWKTVPNAHQRYSDAMVRHELYRGMGENLDAESGLKHLAHMAWNVLAILELEITGKV